MSTVRADNFETAAGAQSVTHMAFAKMWAKVDGTGTPSVSADSYNVSSVDDNATGDYDLNYTNSFADSDYGVAGAGGNDTGGTSSGAIVCAQTHDASFVRINVIQVGDGTASDTDRAQNGAVAFGDLA